MDTFKHLSSDYELINANACAASATAQRESSTQNLRDQKDKENRGKKDEKEEQQCLFEQ